MKCQGCNEALNDTALPFKLSKKVAELTLVVHMLFTRNHEREVRKAPELLVLRKLKMHFYF